MKLKTRRRILIIGESTSRHLFDIAQHFHTSNTRAMLFALEYTHGIESSMGSLRYFSHQAPTSHIWIDIPEPRETAKVDALLRDLDITFTELCRRAIFATHQDLPHLTHENELVDKYFFP